MYFVSQNVHAYMVFKEILFKLIISTVFTRVFFIVRFMLAQKGKCAKLATYSGRLSLIFLSGLRLGDLYQAELAFNPCLV